MAMVSTQEQSQKLFLLFCRRNRCLVTRSGGQVVVGWSLAADAVWPPPARQWDGTGGSWEQSQTSRFSGSLLFSY